MGYTHYYYTENVLNKGNFMKLVEDFNKVLPTLESAMRTQMAGGTGTGKPKINNKEIWFNGKENCGHGEDSECGGSCSHETFHLAQNYVPYEGEYITKDKKGRMFHFTKTARKPYDLAVCVCLIIAKHYLGDQISVHSDGEIGSEWKHSRSICQKLLGYGNDFKLDGEDNE